MKHLINREDYIREYLRVTKSINNIDNEFYFNRPRVYGEYDDGERFAFFSKAVLDMLAMLDFYPDVIHCNDWQTSLVPVYYTTIYGGKEGYTGIKTVITIHNIQYQGKYGKELTAAVAKGNIYGCQFHPEKSGKVGLNILKAFCEME